MQNMKHDALYINKKDKYNSCIIKWKIDPDNAYLQQPQLRVRREDPQNSLEFGYIGFIILNEK